MKSSHLLSFTIGVIVTAVSVSAVSYVNARSDKPIKACADRRTGTMRYIDKGRCKRTERALTWNLVGLSGAAGSQGPAGTTGAAGAQGPAGANGPVGGSSPTGFTARSVCGANGTTLCAVGVQGPGGGVIVYVDTTNEMPGYDYLEAAPTNAPSFGPWATSTDKCGTTEPLTNCRSTFISTLGESLNFLTIGTGRAATAAIVARHNAGGVAKSSYAAGRADAYTTATASDWFLPSRDELNEVCKYARNTGQAAGADTVCSGGTLRIDFASDYYWSSSEVDAVVAWQQYFEEGFQSNNTVKFSAGVVRPVRAF